MERVSVYKNFGIHMIAKVDKMCKDDGTIGRVNLLIFTKLSLRNFDGKTRVYRACRNFYDEGFTSRRILQGFLQLVKTN